LASAGTIALARRIDPRTALRAGAAGLAAGVVVTLLAIQWRSPAAALAGTLLAGAGFGAAFSGSMRSLVPLAQAHERAARISLFLAASYLAFSVPAIVAGLLTNRFGLQPTAVGYGLAAAFLALTTLAPARAPQPA
jgi:predicted MFS family arabinose efflux permease